MKKKIEKEFEYNNSVTWQTMGSNGLMDWKETSSNTNRMAYEKKII